MRDLERFLPLKPYFVLTGNVSDYQICDVGGSLAPFTLPDALVEILKGNGYGSILYFDPANGFHGFRKEDAELLKKIEGLQENFAPALAVTVLARALPKFLELNEPEPVALIANFSGRLILRPDGLEPQENALFTSALIRGYQSQPRPYGTAKRSFFNSVIWIADREATLPDWFTIDNACLRHIPIAKPDASQRRVLAPHLLAGLGDVSNDAPEEFVDATEGMLLRDMTAIAQLGMAEGIKASRIQDAVRHYKIGVTDDPWKKLSREKITNAKATIERRVKGQAHAVTHILDIVKRAMTGVGNVKRGGRPRGFALFAGPTGVGKTELAKAITELLFGDEGSYIRFDMSEFAQEHADQRLIGAPPGYVGYDQGGELTTAIREKPFSVVLFDEIEKAHPRILDKFLQILDDGVLTSGRGDRVYFSESLIIFTSNLGIYKLDDSGKRILTVKQTDEYEKVENAVRQEIERHFKESLQRPELLNRMGDSIVVFDFIRDDVASQIFDAMVDTILKGVEEQEISVTLSDRARNELRVRCTTDLSNGGRGIRNKLETHLVNPLSRWLFDNNARPGDNFAISDISDIEDDVILNLEKVE